MSRTHVAGGGPLDYLIAWVLSPPMPPRAPPSSPSCFSARLRPIYTLSVDEKPGVQALSTTGADLPRYLASMPASGATTSTFATARCRSSRRWICTLIGIDERLLNQEALHSSNGGCAATA